MSHVICAIIGDQMRDFNRRTVGFVPLICPLKGEPVAASFALVEKWTPNAYKSYHTTIKISHLIPNDDTYNVAQP